MRSSNLVMGCWIFALILAASLLLPMVLSIDPNETAARMRFKPPSALHIFGTDGLGRDLFSRVMYGTRVSLAVGGAATLLSCVIGMVVGLCASYFRTLDGVLMRICDGLTAIPAILLAIALMEALGASSVNVVLALVIVYTPGVARIVRVSALAVKGRTFVDAAIVQGSDDIRILRRLILPNSISALTVQASFIFAQAVISEASLSFLGAGIAPPAASLGNLLQAARSEIYRAPWSVAFPGAAVMLCVLSLNLIGDGLRDRLDPHRSWPARRPPARGKWGIEPEQGNDGVCLDIRSLSVAFEDEHGAPLHAVEDATLELRRGEIMGIVGESGSGKSVMSHSILRLRDHETSVAYSGSIVLGGVDVLSLSLSEMRRIRGRAASAIFQDPMTSLDPVCTVSSQICEGMRLHLDISRKEAEDRAKELLSSVGISDAEECMDKYPFELSGGMQQRVMIAMALACSPSLLIADEPTTALDVTVQDQILRLIEDVSRKHDMSVLFISHDLRLVSKLCSRVCVMYLGQIVETAPAAEIFDSPRHPYTRGLLASAPTLDTDRSRELHTIKGTVPPLSQIPSGCRFCTRCGYADWRCRSEAPPLQKISGHLVRCWRPLEPIQKREPEPLRMNIADILNIDSRMRKSPLLEVDGLNKHYGAIHAVRDLSFKIYQGETYGLVGESGCGKTTVGRAVLGLTGHIDGTIMYDGMEISRMNAKELRPLRRRIQTVFQDPLSALDPRERIGAILEDPLELYGMSDTARRREIVCTMLEKVGLSYEHYDRYPHELSGGQAQRIGIARALILEPRLIICDEPVSALDVSIQAQILNILTEMKRELELSLLFISHDICVVKYMADRIGVMYRGRIVEEAGTDEIFASPLHPYTKLLLSSVPGMRSSDDRLGTGGGIASEVRSVNSEPGCAFVGRCPYADSRCRTELPVERYIRTGHRISCWKI